MEFMLNMWIHIIKNIITKLWAAMHLLCVKEQKNLCFLGELIMVIAKIIEGTSFGETVISEY
jgi:hypothetical protein